MLKPQTRLVKCETATDSPYTTSKIVADEFGKEHRHVLRDIVKLIEEDIDFGESNFGRSSYLSDQNKVLPCYNMTEIGCQFLILGFNTKKVRQIKKAFLQEFHAMRDWINESLAAGRADLDEWTARRNQIATDYHHVHEALKQLRADEGKETEHYHYSNEANMINRVILGVDAKTYKELEKVGNVRDSLTTDQIKAFEALQLAATNLLDMGVTDYKVRKHKLEVLFAKKFNELIPLQLSKQRQLR